MENAKAIYDSLNAIDDINALIGKQETVFLDFKETKTEKGVILEDDKRNFSIAAGGFAHQEGGVLVWGIEARKDKEGVDQAISLKPISNLKKFLSELNNWTKYATEPIVDGIQHKKIYLDEAEDKGFIVSYFPQSDKEHQSLGKAPHSFYKRQGDSFVPLSTQDVRNLYFRSRSPQLEFVPAVTQESNSTHIRCSLSNKGGAVAKYAQLLIAFDPQALPTVYDGEGNNYWKTCLYMISSINPYPISLIVRNDLVIHPETDIAMAGLVFHHNSYRGKLKYKILAEGMTPRSGEIDIQIY